MSDFYRHLLEYFANNPNQGSGNAPPAAKRGPARKLRQQVERIQRLLKTQQRFVMQMLYAVFAQTSH